MQRASVYRLTIGFIIAFTLLIGIDVLAYQQNAALVYDTSAVSHTHQTIARLANLIGAEDTADSDVQLAVLTHAPETIAAAHAALDRIAPALADLRTMTTDNPNQQQRLDRLEPLLRTHVAHYEAELQGIDLTATPVSTENEIDTLIRSMEQEERELLNVRTAQSLVSVQRTQQIIVGGSVLGLLIGFGTASIAIVALRSRDNALSDLAILNSQLDARVHQQTAALSVANEQLAALSHQLIATQEVERGTMATTLHEEIGQEIAALQLNLQILEDTSSDPAVRTQLAASMTAIDRVLDQIRSLSFDLRPAMLDDFGLPEAIRATIEPLATQAGLALTIDVTPLSQRPSADVETACFRIAQDAIAMLIRAPGIQALSMRLVERADALELSICGVGIDAVAIDHEFGPHNSTLELLEIRERAAAVGGEIAINPTSERDTEIIARFPLALPTTHERR